MGKIWKKYGLILLVFTAISLLSVSAVAGETKNITNGFLAFSPGWTGCWFCSLYKTIFCAGNAMAVSIFNALARSCINLAAVIMALWICWMVFKLFLGFSSDAAGFFANLFKALFIFVTCAFILDTRMGGGAKFVFDMFMV